MQVKALVATRSVDELNDNQEFLYFCLKSLNRFLNGDWGDVCTEDKISNDEALADGYFILGSYDTQLSPEGKLWIAADCVDDEGNRVITMLLPSEY